jgi:hypothetical protein
VLSVDEIGQNISGEGMVSMCLDDLELSGDVVPNIQKIVVALKERNQ